MAMPLAFAGLFVKDIDRAATFYAEAFGLPELTDMSTDIFRPFDLGNGTVLALHAYDAYALVGLDEHVGSTGVRSLLTFDPGSADAVDAGVERLVAAGATLVEGPFVTVYNARQAVFHDPEGHVVRLSHQLPGRPPVAP
jgi:predicted enzyme related to lactoylglutathione lyase